MLSAVITCVVRAMLDRAPLHGFSAPVRGSGKSILGDICAVIATGRRVTTLTWSPREDEAEKRLGAALIQGAPVLSLDNIVCPLGGELLCQVLTQESVQVRPLGITKLVTIPSAVALLATGNNLTVIGDMTRRALIAELEPREERPELRKFDNDPVADALASRVKLANAVLTIVSAWMRSKDEVDLEPLGSFEEWSATVRSALCWLGMTDPIEVMQRTYDSDPEKDQALQLIGAWKEHFAHRSIPLNAVITKAVEKKVDGSPKRPELHEAVANIAGTAGMNDSRALAAYLRKIENRIFSGLTFESPGMHRSNVRLWRLTKRRSKPGSQGYAGSTTTQIKKS